MLKIKTVLSIYLFGIFICVLACQQKDPEEDLIRQFWPDKNQPITATPIIKKVDGELHISCPTEGATIGYKLPADEQPEIGWQVYQQPIASPALTMKIVAHRIGYLPSDTLIYQN